MFNLKFKIMILSSRSHSNFFDYYDMLFPASPRGFVPVLPWVEGTSAIRPQEYWLVKGNELYHGSKAGRQRLPSTELFAQTLEIEARKLPFTADGVYCAVVKKPYGFLVYLINPGVFESRDIQTALKVNCRAGDLVFLDAISGDILKAEADSVRLTVPAALFRIIAVKQANSSKESRSGS